MLLKTDQDVIKSFLEDSSNLQGGNCEGVIFPESKEEAEEAVRESAMLKRALTVSGAGTGTVGGRIPFGGWALSTEKLNKIIDIDAKTKKAFVEPGVTLNQLDEALRPFNLAYAPDPTEKSAFIGGTISTNASGARSFRYGSTRDHVSGIKIALSSHKTVVVRRGEKSKFTPVYLIPDVKTSAGYYLKPHMDLLDLFIGSEGTLGLILEAELNLTERPKEIINCIVFFDEEDKSIAFARELLMKDDILSLEYFDENSLNLLREKYSRVHGGAKAAIFFEQDVNPSYMDSYLKFWEGYFKKHDHSMDWAWFGMNESQKKELKDFRHALPERINEIYRERRQQKISLDIAVPQHRFSEMINLYDNTLRENKLFYVKFGHIGDSHLHVNIIPGSDEEKKKSEEIALFFITRAIAMRGTVSAEHGIGKIKHHFLYEMFHEGGLKEMVRIKKKFDPALIFGLDNIFPRKLLR